MSDVLAQLLSKTCVAELNRTQKQDTLVLSTNDTLEEALTKFGELDILSAPVLDEEALTTVGIIDVLDILKVFSESYRAEDSLDVVRANWQQFTRQKVKDVFGAARRRHNFHVVPIMLSGRVLTAMEIMRNGIQRLPVMNAELGYNYPYIEFVLSQSDILCFLFAKTRSALHERIRQARLQGTGSTLLPPERGDDPSTADTISPPSSQGSQVVSGTAPPTASPPDRAAVDSAAAALPFAAAGGRAAGCDGAGAGMSARAASAVTAAAAAPIAAGFPAAAAAAAAAEGGGRLGAGAGAAPRTPPPAASPVMVRLGSTGSASAPSTPARPLPPLRDPSAAIGAALSRYSSDELAAMPRFTRMALAVLPGDDILCRTVEQLGFCGTVRTVTNDMTTLECFQYMNEVGVGGVAVVDHFGRIISSLSAADIRGLCEDLLPALLLPPIEFVLQLEAHRGIPISESRKRVVSQLPPSPGSSPHTPITQPLPAVLRTMSPPSSGGLRTGLPDSAAEGAGDGTAARAGDRAGGTPGDGDRDRNADSSGDEHDVRAGREPDSDAGMVFAWEPDAPAPATGTVDPSPPPGPPSGGGSGSRSDASLAALSAPTSAASGSTASGSAAGGSAAAAPAADDAPAAAAEPGATARLPRPESVLSGASRATGASRPGVSHASQPVPMRRPPFLRQRASSGFGIGAEMQLRATPVHVVLCAPNEPLLAVLERFFRDPKQWVRRMYVVDADRRPIGDVTMTKVIAALYADAVPRVAALTGGAAAAAPVAGSVLSRLLMSGAALSGGSMGRFAT